MSCEKRPAADCDPPPYAITKACAECGANLLCGPQEDNGDCWCDRLPNIMPLNRDDDRCLCKPCLQVAIEHRIAANANSLNESNPGIATP